jgi:hypothetical protein
MSQPQRVSARGRGTFLSAAPATDSVEKKSRKEEGKPSSPSLVKVNWQVRPDRLEQIKLHAVKNRRKLYEVLDEALESYLTTKVS